MCQSQAQGGIRCSGIAGGVMQKAAKTYAASGTEDDYQAYLDTQANFAASPGGMKQVKEARDRAEAAGDEVMMMTLQRSIDRGEMLRQRSKDLRTALGLKPVDRKQFAHDPGGNFGGALGARKPGDTAPEAQEWNRLANVTGRGSAFTPVTGASAVEAATAVQKWNRLQAVRAVEVEYGVGSHPGSAAPRDTGGWSFEKDPAVAGTPVTPSAYDAPASTAARKQAAHEAVQRLDRHFLGKIGASAGRTDVERAYRKALTELSDPAATDEQVVASAHALGRVMTTHGDVNMGLVATRQMVKEVSGRDVRLHMDPNDHQVLSRVTIAS